MAPVTQLSIAGEAIGPRSYNTIRCTEYENKLARLSEDRRKAVLSLEAKLFGRLRAALSEKGSLPYCRVIEEYPEGAICYFFSRHNRNYRLLDFEVAEGGGGGVSLHSGAAVFSCGAPVFYPDREFDWAARWAAAYRAEIERSRVKTLADFFPALRVLIAHLSSRIRVAVGLNPLPSPDPLLKDRLRAHILAASSSTERASALPEWSLFGRFVFVPEQLQSNYARAILAGEMLCWLGGSAGLRRHFAAQGYGIRPACPQIAVSNGWLSEEGPHLDGSERSRAADSRADPRARGGLHLYLSACIDDGDFLHSEARLLMAKTAMTLHCAAAVSRMADILAVPGNHDWASEATLADCQDVLRKFALLSDFVQVSDACFESHAADRKRRTGAAVSTGDPWRAEDGERDWASHARSFGKSTSLVVAMVTGSHGYRLAAGAGQPELRRRLSSIAVEILRPTR